MGAEPEKAKKSTQTKESEKTVRDRLLYNGPNAVLIEEYRSCAHQISSMVKLFDAELPRLSKLSADQRNELAMNALGTRVSIGMFVNSKILGFSNGETKTHPAIGDLNTLSMLLMTDSPHVPNPKLDAAIVELWGKTRPKLVKTSPPPSEKANGQKPNSKP